MTLKNIFITGADGMVGSYADFGIRLDRHELDVTDSAAVHTAFEKYRPTAVIHLAAITNQVACEEDPERAFMVNETGAQYVALAARVAGARMLYVSTNAIFNGSGEKPFSAFDTPDPQTIYGRSKYAGERAVRDILPDALIVRTSWIFGGGPEKDKKFVGKVIRQLHAGISPIKAAPDVRGTPTYGKDLMEMIIRFLAEKKSGVVHLTNTGSASRYDMALCIKDIVGSSADIVPVDASSFGGHVLHNETLTGETMRPWQDALREYIETEWGNNSKE